MIPHCRLSTCSSSTGNRLYCETLKGLFIVYPLWSCLALSQTIDSAKSTAAFFDWQLPSRSHAERGLSQHKILTAGVCG